MRNKDPVQKKKTTFGRGCLKKKVIDNVQQ